VAVMNLRMGSINGGQFVDQLRIICSSGGLASVLCQLDDACWSSGSPVFESLLFDGLKSLPLYFSSNSVGGYKYTSIYT
jgi:hypothetical protein